MYSLHITRKISWSNPKGKTILEEEFNNVKQEFVHAVAPYSGDHGYLLYYSERTGNIDIDRPKEEFIEEIAKVAQKLSANVQGDDGEIYADFTEVHSPLKSDYRKVRKANLPEGFPVIDDINRKAKVATKMEVLDLHQEEYKDLKAIERYIKQYIEKLKYLSRIIWNGYNLAQGQDFNNSVLEIAIPEGKATQAQVDKLVELQVYARNQGVTLVISEVP